ncbi:hypothetical protein METP2_02239 [Methanosarcinales archaeon]|nr:hypothetical protein METP2_02239 [Methanosarcinales archaeon]
MHYVDASDFSKAESVTPTIGVLVHPFEYLEPE